VDAINTEGVFGFALAIFGLHVMGAPTKATVGVPSFAAGVFIMWRALT